MLWVLHLRGGFERDSGDVIVVGIQLNVPVNNCCDTPAAMNSEIPEAEMKIQLRI